MNLRLAIFFVLGALGAAATHAAPVKKALVAPAKKLVASPKPAPKKAAPALPRTEPLPRVVANPNDPHEQRVTLLRQRLLDVLRSAPLASTRNGVLVMRASDGEELFSYNADSSFNPASNTKMLTTAAALAYLGGDYRYRTGLWGPAPTEAGVVDGDLSLRGSGDPSLGTSDLAELAAQLAARGVTQIAGDLYADPRQRDTEHPEGAGEGAIILNRNTYRVRVRATTPGKPVAVSLEPRSEFIRIDNRATTQKGKRSRITVDASRQGDGLVVTVRGRLGEARGEVVVGKRIGDAGPFAAAVLRQALADFGIALGGAVKVGVAPKASEAVMLVEHKSPPLAEVCSISNKPSNNFVADTIFKTVGGVVYGVPGTLDKGVKAVSKFLGALGVKPRYRLVNGSGLTHETRITPNDLGLMLRKVYHDLSVAPDFLTSLAVAGIDGTIRNRFAGTDAVGLVRAKTGTLNSVSALSGYVGERDDVLVFAIFVEGFRHKRTPAIRHAQVRLVQMMLRYLRSDGHDENEPIPSEEEDPPEVNQDSEADGDP